MVHAKILWVFSPKNSIYFQGESIFMLKGKQWIQVLCVHWLTSICTVLFLVILPVHSSQLHLLFKTSEMKGLFDQVPCVAKLVSFPILMACRTAESRVFGVTSLSVTGTEHASVYTCVPPTEREHPECAVSPTAAKSRQPGAVRPCFQRQLQDSSRHL